MTHRLARSKCKTKVGQRFDCDGVTYELQGKLGDGAAGIVRKAIDFKKRTSIVYFQRTRHGACFFCLFIVNSCRTLCTIIIE